MQQPQKRVYRMCPSCSSPVLLEDEICRECGYSFLPGAVEAEARHILAGKVFHNGRWIGIKDKLREERMLGQQLASGLVSHEGRWVSIPEKVRREIDEQKSNGPNVVSFPVKSGTSTPLESTAADPDSLLQEEEDEENSPQYDRLRKRRRVILVLLSALTFLSMAVATVGIFISQGFSLP